jgi:hypothetical protein
MPDTYTERERISRNTDPDSVGFSVGDLPARVD